MRESCNIIKQLLDKMPDSGEVRTKLQPNPKAKPGESYKTSGIWQGISWLLYCN